MNNLLKFIALVFFSILFTSCEDDLPIDNPPLGDYENGFFIVNEGPFGSGTGTLTYVGENQETSQNVYQAVNNDEEIGNVANAIYFYNNNAFIVSNNSHKIMVTNRYTMKKTAIIEGENIKNPRFFVAVGSTGYVSNWGVATDATDDFISIIDLSTNTVTGTISVGEGPEKMLVKGSKIYVNLKGGYGQNNKVEVIDTVTNTVEATIIVGDVPNSILKDASNHIWVLCGGKPNWTGSETKGQLVKIVNDNVVNTFDFELTEHPANLCINNTKLYYNLNDKVRSKVTDDSPLNTNNIDGLDGFYYTMAIKNGLLYATNAGDFTSEGSLQVFNLSDNTQTFTTTTGIIPTQVVFQ